jgi:tRNA A-37 threonylcarbamoyl transferase component Bud32
MSIDNNERVLIGEGRVAKVYLQNGFAYKCFQQTYPINWIAYEVSIQKEIASKTKLPVLTYEYIDQSYEIKMPYIKGVELTDRMQKEKYKYGLEDLIALQKQVYHYENLQLPHAHDVFLDTLMKSNVDDLTKNIGVVALETIERKNTLCHFDFHFSNIMYDRLNYFIIDWVNAKLGNPILDIARTYVLLRQYAFRISNKYLKSIAKDLSIELASFKNAIKLMAVLRMIEMHKESPDQRLLDLIYI